MIVGTQLLSWSLLVAVQRVASSHPGVTRVLPVEGGLTDFRVGPAPAPAPAPAPSPSPPRQHPSTAPPTLTPPSQSQTQSLLSAPLRGEYGSSESSSSAVRFPNNLDLDPGGPLVRGAPSYPTWNNNPQGYTPPPAPQELSQGTEAFQMEPATDSTSSASGNAYRQGEYIAEDLSTPGLIGGQTDSEVTFRDEHHPSILIKNPTFNSVAIGFMVYLILLTVLQNSMLNWSQKGSLLTLGATRQRNQREAVDRGNGNPLISTTPTPATTTWDDDADHRAARIQPEPEIGESSRSPISVAAILNDDPHPVAKARTTGKARTAGAGPRTFTVKS